MKRILFVTLAAIIALSVCSFTLLGIQTIRSLERLGIPADVTKQCVWSSFSGGYLSYPTVAKLKQVAVGQRAAVVREIAEFARNYTRSEEFGRQYLEFREGQKPTPPEPLKSMAERRREDKEQMRTTIRETEANMRTMPAEYRAGMQQSIDMMKQQLKEIDNPDNPAYSAEMEEMYRQTYETGMQEYRTKLAEWEKEYPTSPTPMIKKWLTEFLEVSKDVDFNAELKPGEFGKKVFVKPDYESKSPNWKMCYRAGRETVQAGREAAQRWLRELR